MIMLSAGMAVWLACELRTRRKWDRWRKGGRCDGWMRVNSESLTPVRARGVTTGTRGHVRREEPDTAGCEVDVVVLQARRTEAPVTAVGLDRSVRTAGLSPGGRVDTEQGLRRVVSDRLHPGLPLARSALRAGVCGEGGPAGGTPAGGQ